MIEGCDRQNVHRCRKLISSGKAKSEATENITKYSNPKRQVKNSFLQNDAQLNRLKIGLGSK